MLRLRSSPQTEATIGTGKPDARLMRRIDAGSSRASAETTARTPDSPSARPTALATSATMSSPSANRPRNPDLLRALDLELATDDAQHLVAADASVREEVDVRERELGPGVDAQVDWARSSTPVTARFGKTKNSSPTTVAPPASALERRIARSRSTSVARTAHAPIRRGRAGPSGRSGASPRGACRAEARSRATRSPSDCGRGGVAERRRGGASGAGPSRSVSGDAEEGGRDHSHLTHLLPGRRPAERSGRAASVPGATSFRGRID